MKNIFELKAIIVLFLFFGFFVVNVFHNESKQKQIDDLQRQNDSLKRRIEIDTIDLKIKEYEKNIKDDSVSLDSAIKFFGK